MNVPVIFEEEEGMYMYIYVYDNLFATILHQIMPFWQNQPT